MPRGLTLETVKKTHDVDGKAGDGATPIAGP
jgi:hypothetical protein